MSEDVGDGLTVLVADSDQKVANSIRSQADSQRMHVITAGTVAEARSRLASGGIDCLVVDPRAFNGGDEAFVVELQSTAADCPVVLLTDEDPAALDDMTVVTAETIVEKTDDLGDWSLLVEKIRNAVDGTPPDAVDFEMYRTLVETARDGLYRLDANGVLTYLNESFAEILGYERDELLGTHTAVVMAEGELERGQEMIREVLQSDERESDIMDMEMETNDGDRIVVSIHFVVLTDENGTYDGVMGVMRDITERKERERALRRQNERLEEFASIVSHDLRNPLNVAKGNYDMVTRECDSEYLDPLGTALDRMESLIDETLELARQGDTVTDVEPMALHEIVDGCWEMVESRGASLERNIEATIYGDPERAKQLFENLFRNSIEHAGPDVTITVGRHRDGFYVADDGPGIPDDERDRILEPGFSTDDDGTGFGLTIVKRIVEAHGWTITVAASESSGARFEVTGVEFADDG